MSKHGSVLARRAPTLPVATVRPAAAADRDALPMTPWSAAALRVLLVVVAVAAVVLAVAWYGCSETATWRVQVRWIGLGVLACLLNALGCLAWLGIGARSLRWERVRTTAALRSRDLMPRQAMRAAVSVTEGWVTGGRMRRYHRAECPLMAGKPAESVTVDAATTRGLTACGVCAQ